MPSSRKAEKKGGGRARSDGIDTFGRAFERRLVKKKSEDKIVRVSAGVRSLRCAGPRRSRMKQILSERRAPRGAAVIEDVASR